MQCPKLQSERTAMFLELCNVSDGYRARVLDNSGDILSILLERPSDALSVEQMDAFWLVSCKHVNNMYMRNIKLRKGIG